MNVLVTCPECLKCVQLPSSALGTKAKCPLCQIVFLADRPLPVSTGGAYPDTEPLPPVPLEAEPHLTPESAISPEVPAEDEAGLLSVLPADPVRSAASPLFLPAECGSITPAEVEKLPDPGFWASIGWTLLSLLLPFVGGCFIGTIMVVEMRGQVPLTFRGPLLVLAAVLQAASMLAIVGLVLRFQSRRALALRGIAGLHFLLVLLLVLPSAVLGDEVAIRANQGLEAWLGVRVHPPPTDPDPVPARAYLQFVDQMWQEIAKMPWALALFCGALLPGVVEEVFFRGFIGRGLVARYGAVLGIFLTSLLFALMHIDPVQIAYTMIMGITLHVVFLTTRSLLGPILLHTLYNALAISRMKLEMEGTLILTDPRGEFVVPPALTAASLGSVIALCWLLYQTRVRWLLADGSEWSPRYVTAEMNPFEPAVPRRRALHWAPVLLAAGACLAFGVLYVPAAAGWFRQGQITVQVRHAEALVGTGEYDKAVAACDKAIRNDPQLASAYIVRGDAYRMQGKYRQALADCDTAIGLEPANALAYANRGELHRLQNDPLRAMADCNQAIRLDRRLAWAYTIRGTVHDDRKEYAQAITDWDESLRLDPSHAWTRTRLAWLRASCPDGRYRQGKQAVTLAREACELTEWKDPDPLAALAAAHAECGEFGDAVRWQERVIGLASREQNESYVPMLDLYRSKRPYREER